VGQLVELLLVLCHYSSSWQGYESRGSDNLRLGQLHDSLDVDLALKLRKANCSSASTSAYFQATHVITTRDALEEFMAADIWPCKLRWGSWAFKMRKLPRLDFETRSLKFNIKRREGKTD
jgi:hypothetical protein